MRRRSTYRPKTLPPPLPRVPACDRTLAEVERWWIATGRVRLREGIKRSGVPAPVRKALARWIEADLMRMRGEVKAGGLPGDVVLDTTRPACPAEGEDGGA